MYLTKEQENVLNGENGEALAKLMHLLVKIGEVNNANELIPIQSAQIAGVSYYTVGDAIFSFFKLLSKDNVKVKVPSWLNPAGMDREKWKEMNIEDNFVEKQFKIIQEYSKMGIEETLTCTPYLIGYEPAYGDHLAWSESSAVVIANSFFGARTNREGGPSSLAAALIGLTPNYGLHLIENRQPRVLVDVNTDINSLSDFSAMGYWYGSNYGGSIPIFENIKRLNLDEAKMLASAMAASGSVPIYHIQNITPEAKNVNLSEMDETVIFTDKDLKKVYEHFNQISENVELVAIGCPHASIDDLNMIRSSIKDNRLKDGIEFWVFTSKKLASTEDAAAVIAELEDKGLKIYTETCMVVSPAVRKNYRNIITNSAKASFYLTKEDRTNVNLLSIGEIMEVVVE